MSIKTAANTVNDTAKAAKAITEVLAAVEETQVYMTFLGSTARSKNDKAGAAFYDKILAQIQVKLEAVLACIEAAPAPTSAPESIPANWELAQALVHGGKKVLNLTPHAVTIHGAGGESVTIPPTAPAARLEVTRQTCEPIQAEGGMVIPVSKPTLGAIQDLPDPAPGVIFIVSALVAEAAKRADVMSPGALIRDPAGVITGCHGLCTYV